MPARIHFGANYKIIGKTEPDRISYPGAWEVAEGTIADLAEHIGKGHPWMPALLDGDRKRKQSNSNWAEVLGADIDDGLSIAEALETPIIARYCSLAIESSSSSEQQPKFRLVFCLPEPLTNWQDIRIANQFLIHALGCADGACKDASRFFFGAEGRKPFLLNYEASLPPNFWAKAQEWHKEQEAIAQKQYEEALARRARYVSQDGQQTALDNAWVALTYIPPYTPGNGTYEGLRAMASGVINTFGIEGESLLSQWDAGRGKWGRPFERWLDSLKKSSCARPASLGSLFHLAKQYGYIQPTRSNSVILPPPASASGVDGSSPESAHDVPSDEAQGPGEEEMVRLVRADALKRLVAQSVELEDIFERAVVKSDLVSRYRLRASDIEELQAELSAPPRSLPQSTEEIHSDYLDRICSGQSLGYSLGLESLDEILGGINPSDLTIVAGRPAMGKTTFLQHVVKRFCGAYQLPCLLFSLEMGKGELMDRFVSEISGVSVRILRFNQVTERTFPLVTNALEEIIKWDLIIDDNPSIDLSYIISTTQSVAKDFEGKSQKLGCVLIDYLQLIEGELDNDNRNTAISKISRNLKALAKRMKLPVIALSQLSRNVESRSDKRPLLSDLRESGGIEQDADLVIMLYRDEYYNPQTPNPGECELLIRKNRHGGVGCAKVLFDGACSRFSSIPRY